MSKVRLSRRHFSAGVAATAVAAPFVRGAYAAGKLAVGLWDHWVPDANKASEALIKEWAAKEKVDVTIDYITSQGNKLTLTIAAESQARSGHDIMALPTWWPAAFAEHLVPMNDIVAALIKQNGAVNGTAEYLGKIGGNWAAMPYTVGSQFKGPVSRIDLMKQHAGIDMQEMYPIGGPPKADNWTLETFLKAAEACHKGGVPFGIGLGTTSDSVDTCGAIFQSYGAELVNAKGDIVVKSDRVKQALEYWKQLVRFLPPDAPSWDDASNNKWYVAGKGAMIMNPPSAWAVAKRDAPKIAEQSWHHGFPKGPAGRYGPFIQYFLGVWKFSKNQSAAKSLMQHLSTAAAVETLVRASAGYDIPAFANLTTLKVWAEEAPPKGTLYHYANPHDHQTLSIAAAPAPHKIAQQIYNQAIQTQMVVRYGLRNEPMDQVLGWAARELEGFMRN